ncbi:hypothetical protein JRQ81_007301, partial [Phrynocephalus forsythii]
APKHTITDLRFDTHIPPAILLCVPASETEDLAAEHLGKSCSTPFLPHFGNTVAAGLRDA